MSEIFISEEQFIKFHHWIRIASAKEHSEFHRELTKLGLQEQLWLKQIIVHSEVINNYEIVQDTVPPSPVLSNAPLHLFVDTTTFMFIFMLLDSGKWMCSECSIHSSIRSEDNCRVNMYKTM